MSSNAYRGVVVCLLKVLALILVVAVTSLSFSPIVDADGSSHVRSLEMIAPPDIHPKLTPVNEFKPGKPEKAGCRGSVRRWKIRENVRRFWLKDGGRRYRPPRANCKIA